MKHGKRRSKTLALMEHTRCRMHERYGYRLSSAELHELAEMCRTGKFYFHLGRQSRTRSRIIVDFKGERIPLIYDKKRHCIVTVLTMEMLSPEEKDLIGTERSLELPGSGEKAHETMA